MGTDVVKNVNKNNASHAVLFEALALVCSLLYTVLKQKYNLFVLYDIVIDVCNANNNFHYELVGPTISYGALACFFHWSSELYFCMVYLIMLDDSCDSISSYRPIIQL